MLHRGREPIYTVTAVDRTLDRLYRPALLSLSAVAHGFSFYQLESLFAGLSLPDRWHGQLLFLLALSLASSSLMAVVKRPPVVWILLGMRTMALLAIGMPLGENLMVEFSLLSPLLLEATAYVPLAAGAPCAVLATALTALAQGPAVVAGRTLPRPANFDLASFCLYAAVLLSMGIMTRLFRDRYASGRRSEDRLGRSILRLAQTNVELQEYAVQAERSATERERKRLAREVHDAMGYTLTNLVMMMEAAVDLTGASDAALRSHLERAQDQAREGILEVRRTLQSVRTAEAPAAEGLQAVHRLVQTLNAATHVKLRLHLGDAPLSLGPEADRVAYRLVQEGISNALRHGNASEISIGFSRWEAGVRVSISDNGVGSAALKEGLGLLGMRERIAQAGGRFEIQSGPREGTRLSAWIPLPEGV